MRMLELARTDPEQPYEGSRSNSGEMVRRVRRDLDREQAARDVPIRFEGLPAEYLQVDWGEMRAFPFTQQTPATRYFLLIWRWSTITCCRSSAFSAINAALLLATSVIAPPTSVPVAGLVCARNQRWIRCRATAPCRLIAPRIVVTMSCPPCIRRSSRRMRTCVAHSPLAHDALHKPRDRGLDDHGSHDRASCGPAPAALSESGVSRGGRRLPVRVRAY